MNEFQLHHFARSVAFVGFFFALVFASGQLALRQKKVRHWLIIFIYCCIAALLIGDWNINEKFKYVYPFLSMSNLPFIYTIGPAFYVLVLLTKEENLPQKTWLHFISFPMVTIANLPYYLLPDLAKIDHMRKLNFGPISSWPDWLTVIGVFISIGYILKAIFMLRSLWSFNVFRFDYSVRFIGYILFCAGLVLVSAIFGIIFAEALLLRLCSVIMVLSIIMLHILSHPFPKLFENLVNAVKHSEKRKSNLNNDESKIIASKLKIAMEKELLYRDEDLSLASLANKVDVSIHKLSEYLNEVAGLNFYDYLNSYRVAEAKKLLRNQALTILHVAYKSGFNSKSSFNRIFKKNVSMTPSEFKNRTASEK